MPLRLLWNRHSIYNTNLLVVDRDHQNWACTEIQRNPAVSKVTNITFASGDMQQTFHYHTSKSDKHHFFFWWHETNTSLSHVLFFETKIPNHSSRIPCPSSAPNTIKWQMKGPATPSPAGHHCRVAVHLDSMVMVPEGNQESDPYVMMRPSRTTNPRKIQIPACPCQCPANVS